MQPPSRQMMISSLMRTIKVIRNTYPDTSTMTLDISLNDQPVSTAIVFYIHSEHQGPETSYIFVGSYDWRRFLNVAVRHGHIGFAFPFNGGVFFVSRPSRRRFSHLGDGGPLEQVNHSAPRLDLGSFQPSACIYGVSTEVRELRRGWGMSTNCIPSNTMSQGPEGYVND